MRRSAAVLVAAGMIVSGLAAAPSASAAPGDPAPGWVAPEGEAHRDVAVSGSGRVFSVSLPETGTLDHSSLEHGYLADWARLDVPPSSQGGVVAGPGDYAMAVTGNVSRVFDGTSWDGPVTISPEVWRSKLVGNSDGDAALLWSGGSGLPFLSRLDRGGSWVTGRVPGVPADVPRDVAINNAGKVTVVWAVPTATTSAIRRSVLRPGTTTWSSPRQIGTVNTPRPRLTLVTEGEGRETLLAGNKLWRQEGTTELPTYQFRTSVRAKLATSTAGTRLVWSEQANGEHQFYARSARTGWGPRVLLWEHPGPTDPGCDQGNEFGVGMIPGGRTYIAVAIRSEVGETTEVCGGPYAQFITLDRSNSFLNRRFIFYSHQGTPFQVAAGTAGPVVLEYEPGDWYVDWQMQFYSR